MPLYRLLIVWLVAGGLLLSACQPRLEPPTPAMTPASKLVPSPTSTLQPPASTRVSLPVERLSFTVSLHQDELSSDSIIALVNSDGTSFEMPGLFEPFRETGGVSGAQLNWSPDGRYLAFDGADEIHECALPGTDCITTNYGLFLADYSSGLILRHIEHTLTNFSWSPDGQKLAYSLDESVGQAFSAAIFTLDVEGGQSQRLSGDAVTDLYPSWSPDGAWLAFIRFEPGSLCYGLLPTTAGAGECDNGSLYLVRPDGTDLRRLAGPIHMEAPVDGRNRPYNAPQWSPDGRWLLVMVEGTEYPWLINQEIALVDTRSGSLTRLTTNDTSDVTPVWSPDGQRIAFESGLPGHEEIHVMDVDGSRLQNLTPLPARDFSPVWSPGGNYIAFISLRETGDGLYVMNADGSSPVLISDDTLRVLGRPSWLPRPRP